MSSRGDIPPVGTPASRLVDARAGGCLAAFSALVAVPHMVTNFGVQSLGVLPAVVVAVVFLVAPRRVPHWALTLASLLATGVFTAMAVGVPTIPASASGPVLLALAAMYVSALRSRLEAWLHVGWVLLQYTCLIVATDARDVPFAMDVATTVAVVLVVTGVTTTVRRYLDHLLEQLRHQVDHDPLTGLLNRNGMGHRLAALGDEAALLLVDVDHFNSVNDVHGHLVGDETLVWLAGLMRGALPGSAVVGRFGGEEFVAVLPGAGAAEAHGHAQRLRTLVSTTPAPRATRLTVSIGVAAGPVDHLLDTVLARADAAVYRAKQDGRDRVLLWRPVDAHRWAAGPTPEVLPALAPGTTACR